ncbi:MAG: type II secretion system protein GspG [Phycisphaerae bacterium]|nr:type II secretion system protein GspG [Phycisphaerae bacterium]
MKTMVCTSPRTAARLARGFSLLELTLVLVIIGILIAAAAVNIVGAGSRAKARVTRASLATIKNALTTYNLEVGGYPPTLNTLITAKMLDDKALKDGWKNDFVYDPRGRSKEQPYILGSAGEDGSAGTEDDIDIWTMDK